MDKVNACIISFYMDNIDPKTVELQQLVVKKFNVSEFPHYSIKTNMRHGLSIDHFWAMNGIRNGYFENLKVDVNVNHDIVVILDIDCVPLNPQAIDELVTVANQGTLVGNVQRSNHIENDQHLFVAPSCMGIHRDIFRKIGSPSAVETFRSDVAEEYTFCAEDHEIPVDFFIPSRFDEPPQEAPSWKLREGMPEFGRGTTFKNKNNDELFWHSFQIFHPGQQEKFHQKCLKLL